MEQLFEQLPKLKTKRLMLRKISLNDIEDVFAYGSNPNVSQYVSWETHQSLEDAREFVQFVQEGYRLGKKALWGMELKSTGKIVGTIDFVTVNTKHKRAEIGYVLAEEYWGQGLTTEATERIIAFGFNELDLERIQARCFVDNVGSQRVMEKVGMRWEGTIRKGMLVKGKFRDLKLYSILSEEFHP
ncbi:GNAT family N-acetyltransferase [Halobacillus sp. MO56]